MNKRARGVLALVAGSAMGVAALLSAAAAAQSGPAVGIVAPRSFGQDAAQDAVGAQLGASTSVPSDAAPPFAGSAQQVCGPPSPGMAQCLAEVLQPSGVQPETSTPSGLSPDAIDTVYGYSSSTSAGSGQTIALVDAYNDQTRPAI